MNDSHIVVAIVDISQKNPALPALSLIISRLGHHKPAQTCT